MFQAPPPLLPLMIREHCDDDDTSERASEKERRKAFSLTETSNGELRLSAGFIIRVPVPVILNSLKRAKVIRRAPLQRLSAAAAAATSTNHRPLTHCTNANKPLSSEE